MRVKDWAWSLFLERGVRHGAVALTPIAEVTGHHAHGDDAPHAAEHLRVPETS